MADEEKKEEASGGDGSDQGSGGGNKLVLILTAVNVLATLGVIGVLFMSFQKEKAHQDVSDISTEEPHAQGEGGEVAEGAKGAAGEGAVPQEIDVPDFGKMISLEQFTVNLSTGGSTVPKFARVNISIEVPTEDIESELTQKMPQVRNTIIDLFNGKRANDLANPSGRNDLKVEIQNAINDFLVTGKVKGVFFTNFALTS